MIEIIEVMIFFSVGIVMIAYSVKPFRTMRAITKSDDVSVSDTISRGDMVQVRGRVIPHEDRIRSPIEDRECVAYEYTISKSSRDDADPKNDHYWKDLETGNEAVDFSLEDHTGTAHIRTTGSEISLTHDSRYTTSDPVSVPTTVTGDPIPFDPTEFEFDDRLRFNEGTITSGDWVSVIGEFSAEKTKEGDGTETTATDVAYVFDGDTDDKVRRLRNVAITTFVFGFAFASFAVAYVVIELL